MVSFTKIGEMGRLGNQLFQYAALKAVALRNGYDYGIPIESKTWHSQECLLSNFKINKEKYYPIKFLKLRTAPSSFVEKDPQMFDPDFFNIKDNEDILGFFQNINYFISYDQEIRNDFELKPEISEYSEEYVLKIKETTKKQVVSLHVRRGDLVEQPNHEGMFGTNKFDTDSIFYKYMTKAMSFFKDVIFLVFTGGSRLGNRLFDIEWCKKNIVNDNIYYCEGHSDIQDFGIMSSCDHNILCHSSTFGWWAGYLNKNKNKTVIAPEKYFVTDRNRIVDGFYPKDFKLID